MATPPEMEEALSSGDGGTNPGPLTSPTRVKEDPANLMGQEQGGSLNRAGSCLRC